MSVSSSSVCFWASLPLPPVMILKASNMDGSLQGVVNRCRLGDGDWIIAAADQRICDACARRHRTIGMSSQFTAKSLTGEGVCTRSRGCMLASLRTAAVFGVEACPVIVEVDVSFGLPCFTMVGLPDASVRESRDRVRSAIRNSGFEFPTIASP